MCGLSAPSSRTEMRAERDGMVETFDCDTAGLPGQRDERGELGHGTLSFR